MLDLKIVETIYAQVAVVSFQSLPQEQLNSLSYMMKVSMIWCTVGHKINSDTITIVLEMVCVTLNIIIV